MFSNVQQENNIARRWMADRWTGNKAPQDGTVVSWRTARKRSVCGNKYFKLGEYTETFYWKLRNNVQRQNKQNKGE